MAVVGIAQMWLKRENAAVLLRFCAVAMFATVIVNDEATTTSAVALVVIGIGIALFTTTPQLEPAGYSTALLLALAFNGDSDLSNALPEAAVITALFIFGAGRLRQIIRNLIVNAQRYGRDPIRVVARGTGDTMMLEIRDSGPQLPIEQQRAIFDRYHRAGQRPGVAASVGVGLTVSRELARAMGGDVTYGHDGETVFTLSLPCATVPVGPAVGSRLTETSHLAG